MLKKMMWIGLTGGIASGKSTVAKLFKGRGISVIDADLIAHQVVEPGTSGLKAVLEEFGEDYLDAQGRLDRKALGRKVFQDPRALSKLENILHPFIQAEVVRQREVAEGACEGSGAQFVVYDVPLLFEKKMESQFDGIVTVVTSLENQKSRMRVRDGLSEAEIDDRLSSQMDLTKKAQQSHWIIENNSDLQELESNFSRVFQQIQSAKT